MKQFMDENFLLRSETAQKLSRSSRRRYPILDYHCHINPQEMSEDRPVWKCYPGMARRRPLRMALYAFLWCR